MGRIYDGIWQLFFLNPTYSGERASEENRHQSNAGFLAVLLLGAYRAACCSPPSLGGGGYSLCRTTVSTPSALSMTLMRVSSRVMISCRLFESTPYT